MYHNDVSKSGDLGSVISAKDNPATNTDNWVNSVVDQNRNTAAAVSLAHVQSSAIDLTNPNESVLPPGNNVVTLSFSVPISIVSSSFPGVVQNVTQLSVLPQLVPSNAPRVYYSRPMSSAQKLNPTQSGSFSQQHLPHKNAGIMTNTATVVPPDSNLEAFHDTRLLQMSLPKLSLGSSRVMIL